MWHGPLNVPCMINPMLAKYCNQTVHVYMLCVTTGAYPAMFTSYWYAEGPLWVKTLWNQLVRNKYNNGATWHLSMTLWYWLMGDDWWDNLCLVCDIYKHYNAHQIPLICSYLRYASWNRKCYTCGHTNCGVMWDTWG